MMSVRKHTDLNITQKPLRTAPESQDSTNIHSSLGFFSPLFPTDEEAGRSTTGVTERSDPGQSRWGTFSRRRTAPEPDIPGRVFCLKRSCFTKENVKAPAGSCRTPTGRQRAGREEEAARDLERQKPYGAADSQMSFEPVRPDVRLLTLAARLQQHAPSPPPPFPAWANKPLGMVGSWRRSKTDQLRT